MQNESDIKREKWLGGESNEPLKVASHRRVSAIYRKCQGCGIKSWIDFDEPTPSDKANATPCPECATKMNAGDSRKVAGWGNQPLWKVAGLSESQFNKFKIQHGQR